MRARAARSAHRKPLAEQWRKQGSGDRKRTNQAFSCLPKKEPKIELIWSE